MTKSVLIVEVAERRFLDHRLVMEEVWVVCVLLNGCLIACEPLSASFVMVVLFHTGKKGSPHQRFEQTAGKGFLQSFD